MNTIGLDSTKGEAGPFTLGNFHLPRYPGSNYRLPPTL